MAFSWKQSKKEAISHCKQRLLIYEKNGEMQKADKLKHKIKRMQQ